MSFDTPYAGGGGLFPYANGRINSQHPLAPNLTFLGVAYPGGFRDLVSGTHSSFFTATSPQVGAVIALQHTGTSAGAGWQFGSGTNTLQSRAVFSGLNCNPLSAMNMALACGFMNPIGAVTTGAQFRLLTVENPATLNTGGMELSVFSTQPRVDIGGNGGTNNLISGLTTTTSGQAENVVASNDTGTCTLYVRTGTNTAATTSRTSASGVTQVTFSALSGSAARCLIWGAAWNMPLTAAQAALITPLRGRLPQGLVLPRRWAQRA